MGNGAEIKEIKQSIGGFVRSLEKLKTLLAQETAAYAVVRADLRASTAFHKVQVCTEQEIGALLELDMVLEDLLHESAKPS